MAARHKATALKGVSEPQLGQAQDVFAISWPQSLHFAIGLPERTCSASASTSAMRSHFDGDSHPSEDPLSSSPEVCSAEPQLNSKSSESLGSPRTREGHKRDKARTHRRQRPNVGLWRPFAHLAFVPENTRDATVRIVCIVCVVPAPPKSNPAKGFVAMSCGRSRARRDGGSTPDRPHQAI